MKIFYALFITIYVSVAYKNEMIPLSPTENLRELIATSDDVCNCTCECHPQCDSGIFNILIGSLQCCAVYSPWYVMINVYFNHLTIKILFQNLNLERILNLNLILNTIPIWIQILQSYKLRGFMLSCSDATYVIIASVPFVLLHIYSRRILLSDFFSTACYHYMLNILQSI
jgi:hypothetical protein